MSDVNTVKVMRVYKGGHSIEVRSAVGKRALYIETTDLHSKGMFGDIDMYVDADFARAFGLALIEIATSFDKNLLLNVDMESM